MRRDGFWVPRFIGLQERYVYARLPRAGLGNKLLVWARATVFAELNGFPLATSSWVSAHVGPWLRGELRKRWYGGSFRRTSQANTLHAAVARAMYRHVQEPAIKRSDDVPPCTVIEFNRVPHHADYFGSIRDHRTLLRARLHAMVSSTVQRRLREHPAPCIAVHVRQGDFQLLKPGESLSDRGNARTPVEYFVDVIYGVRALAGRDMPVTVFSDGQDGDLAPLLRLPMVQRASTDNPDIVDLLQMSRSKLLVCSAGSTFSYWAGYLADGPILLHPDQVQTPLRPSSVNEKYFEGSVRGPCTHWPALLKQNIAEIGRSWPNNGRVKQDVQP